MTRLAIAISVCALLSAPVAFAGGGSCPYSKQKQTTAATVTPDVPAAGQAERTAAAESIHCACPGGQHANVTETAASCVCGVEDADSLTVAAD